MFWKGRAKPQAEAFLSRYETLKAINSSLRVLMVSFNYFTAFWWLAHVTLFLSIIFSLHSSTFSFTDPFEFEHLQDKAHF